MNKNQRFPLILACALFTLGLLSLALLGMQARYMQDDYCFDFLLKQDGFFAAQWRTYFEETAFNGNRYSTNIVMGLAAHIGVSSAQILPLLILTAQLAGGCFLLNQLNRWFPFAERLPCASQQGDDHEISHREALLSKRSLSLPDGRFVIIIAIFFLTYTLTPNPFQSLFWRPASVTYSLPMAFLAFLGGAVLDYGDQPAFKPFHAVLAFLLALVAGGFAEHATVLECSLLVIALIFVLIYKRNNPRLTSLQKPLLASLAGAVAALLLMLLSPAARLRQQLLFPTPPSISEGLTIALIALRDFILRALYRLPMHTVWTLLTAVFLGLWQGKPDSKHLLRRFSLTLLIGFGLLFSLCLPGALATSAPPEERAQVLMSAVWVVMLIALGFQIGRAMRQSASLARSVLCGLTFLALGLSLLVPSDLPFSPAYPQIRTWLLENPALASALLAVVILIVWLTSRVNTKSLTHWIFLAAALMAVLPGLLDVFEEIKTRRHQAALWDWRAEQINTAIARGQTELTLPALDSVAGVLELQESADHWVNNCAELFYGLDVLRAEQPVLMKIPDGSNK